jgi:integrase
MSLKLMKQRDGTPRPFWYAEYQDGGKRRVINLGIKWKGTPPEGLHLSEEGDRLFETSRDRAQSKLDSYLDDVSHKGNAEHLTERLIESKTGRKVEYVKLAELPEKWRGLGRESKPSEKWLKWCDTILNRFAADALPCLFLHEVTPEKAAAYVDGLRTEYTRKTANGAASLLRSAFEHFLPTGTQNPFDTGIKKRGHLADDDTVHRRPLTAAELKLLFEVARPEPMLYRLTTTAALTGLRIGDVCLLRWQSVDLRAGFVSVATAKTGKPVELPIWPPLREVFETALAEREPGAEYVFPGAARMYRANRYGIVYRGKSLFARAFAPDGKAPQDVPEGGRIAPERADLAEALPDVTRAVESRFDGLKRARILDSLKRYASGQTYREIEKETGRQRGQVSQDLKDAEQASGLCFRKGTPTATGRDMKTLIAATRQAHGKGRKLSACLLGWHSLRGTWATLALSAGIPVETVKLITGHGTANTVLKYYYNPQREHLREVLGDKLPEVLTGRKAAALLNPKSDTLATLAAQLQQLNGAERVWLANILKEAK